MDVFLLLRFLETSAVDPWVTRPLYYVFILGPIIMNSPFLYLRSPKPDSHESTTILTVGSISNRKGERVRKKGDKSDIEAPSKIFIYSTTVRIIETDFRVLLYLLASPDCSQFSQL